MWRPWAIRRGGAGSNANGLDIAGVVAIAALAYMHWKFRTVVSVTDGGTQGYDLLYRGGLIAVGVATVVLIATVTHPRSRLGKYIIGMPILVWIGKRSYGLYLYHWVIFQAYRKSAGVGLQLREFIALMAITTVVTEASYQFLETPIRTGRALAIWRGWRARGGRVRGPLAVTMATLAVVPVFSVVSMVGARVIPDDVTASLTDNEDAVTSISSTTQPSSETTQPVVTTTTIPKEKIDVLAVGDSVMLGSAKSLSDVGLTVDAAKNRQVLEALQIFNYYKSTGELGDNVVIHLGTNGKTTPGTFAQILTPLAGVARVVVLTVHVPNREYQAINNAIINDLPLSYPNVTVLDWYSLAKLNKSWLSSDGVHLKTEGRKEYVKFILQALGR
jgi:lysophospholipase L1-like esterase